MRSADDSGHREGKFTMSCGRVVTLDWLRQYKTYRGHMTMPIPSTNDSVLQSLFEKESEDLPGGKIVAMIDPPRIKEAYEAAARREYGERGEYLPAITCIAHFTHDEPMDDSDDSLMDASSMKVIWMQDHFAMPIAPEPLARILALDWKHFSYDWSYWFGTE